MLLFHLISNLSIFYYTFLLLFLVFFILPRVCFCISFILLFQGEKEVRFCISFCFCFCFSLARIYLGVLGVISLCLCLFEVWIVLVCVFLYVYLLQRKKALLTPTSNRKKLFRVFFALIFALFKLHFSYMWLLSQWLFCNVSFSCWEKKYFFIL